MTVRSQTLALIVLFAGLAVVFLLVGTGDLNTNVFTSQPTASPTAPPEPTPVPVEELWTEQAPGQLLYAADPETQAVIVFETMSSTTFAQQQGIDAPPEDAPYPLLDMLGQIRASLEQQAAEQNIVVEEAGLVGPYVEEVNGVGVAFFRAMVDRQPVAGGEFPGLDREWALVERPDGDVTMVLYGLQGESDPTVYADYRAWLAANVEDLAAPAEDAEAEGEATPAPEGEAEEETATPDAAETPEGDAEITEPETPEAEAETAEGESAETDEETLEGDAETTEPETPEAEAETAEGESAETAEETAPQVTPAPTEEAVEAEAEAETEAQAADKPAPADAADADAQAAEEGPWSVIGPGQLRYTDIPNAFLFYNVVTREEFVTQSGAQPIDEDDPAPLLTLLEFMQDQIETQLTESGTTFGPESFEGPEMQEYDGVPVAFMWIVIEAQTVEGQTSEGQELAIALIERGDGTLTVVEFIYLGAPNPELSQAVRDWLDDNAARLADPTQPLPELEPPAGEGEEAEPAPADAAPEAEATVEAEGAIGEEAGD